MGVLSNCSEFITVHYNWMSWSRDEVDQLDYRNFYWTIGTSIIYPQPKAEGKYNYIPDGTYKYFPEEIVMYMTPNAKGVFGPNFE